jgi:hypothetical protein
MREFHMDFCNRGMEKSTALPCGVKPGDRYRASGTGDGPHGAYPIYWLGHSQGTDLDRGSGERSQGERSDSVSAMRTTLVTFQSSVR